MSEPKALFLACGTEIPACICGGCGRIWESKDSAARCCTCSFCGKGCDWRGGVSHDACHLKAQEDGEVEALTKAVLVADYDGPFLVDERVYLDSEQLLDSLDLEDLPEYGFCTSYQAPEIDMASIIDDIQSNMHSDWEENTVPEMDAAIAAWNKANEANGTYWEDRDRKWSRTLVIEQHSQGASAGGRRQAAKVERPAAQGKQIGQAEIDAAVEQNRARKARGE